MTARKVFANIDINIYFFVLTLNFEIGDLESGSIFPEWKLVQPGRGLYLDFSQFRVFWP